MKKRHKFPSLALGLSVALIVLGFQKTPAVTETDGFEPVALIELFTSQGYSSCPPADKLLAKTIADAGKDGRKVYALSFHVDYWNRLGWTDPFSDHKYSERQSAYVSKMKLESAYTPQMVINGTHELVGSDAKALTQNIGQVLLTKSLIAFRKLTTTSGVGKPIHVDYELAGDISNSHVLFALVNFSETTVVKRGENGGHTLQSQNVVHQLLEKEAARTGAVDFAPTSVAGAGNMEVVAFVQAQEKFKVVGASATKILK